MTLTGTSLRSCTLLLLACAFAWAQTGDAKHFSKDGLSFDYPSGWSLKDESNSDAQTLRMARADGDIQITVFVHRGRITPEKMADAQKAFINPYVEGTAKQFADMGARVERTPDSTDIAETKADGVKLKAIVPGDSATSQIYWALVGQRVVILTYFGPDGDRKKFAGSWDLVRNSLRIEEPKPAAKPTPKPTPK
jgi:hypothetical protein